MKILNPSFPRRKIENERINHDLQLYKGAVPIAKACAHLLARRRRLQIDDRPCRTVRVDLLREHPEAIGPLLSSYRNILNGQNDGRTTWRHLKALNQLGVTRGTLNLV